MTSWSSRIKICFYKLIESIIKKICHGVKQNAKKNVPLVKQNVMKLEVFIKELIRRERRDGGEGEGMDGGEGEERGLRKGVG